MNERLKCIACSGPTVFKVFLLWGATTGRISLSQYFRWRETLSVLYFFGYFIADWMLYNFAAGSIHTTKLCSRVYSIEIEFYSEKKKNRFLSHPLGTYGVTYNALHLYLVGKPAVDFLFIIIDFFAISYGWDVISWNLSKSAFFEGSEAKF